MERSPLFVRLPRGYAEKLDRAAFELKTPKQALVAGLVGRYVNPSTAEGLQNRRAVAAEGGFGFGTRRITVEQETDDVTVGRVGFVPAPEPPTGDVLTLEQVAVLLRAPGDAGGDRADAGELPGRETAGGGRFARQAVLDWLGGS